MNIERRRGVPSRFQPLGADHVVPEGLIGDLWERLLKSATKRGFPQAEDAVQDAFAGLVARWPAWAEDPVAEGVPQRRVNFEMYLWRSLTNAGATQAERRTQQGPAPGESVGLPGAEVPLTPTDLESDFMFTSSRSDPYDEMMAGSDDDAEAQLARLGQLELPEDVGDLLNEARQHSLLTRDVDEAVRWLAETVELFSRATSGLAEVPADQRLGRFLRLVRATPIAESAGYDRGSGQATNFLKDHVYSPVTYVVAAVTEFDEAVADHLMAIDLLIARLAATGVNGRARDVRSYRLMVVEGDVQRFKWFFAG
ncbi:MAG: hypothetical protein GY788_07685 [bacterium]|nr:hypothetical protein [bacterium]